MNSRRKSVLLTCVVAALLQGCSIAGPKAIHSGRMAYNQAIADTNNQQMLMVPVHNRYEESNHLLAVASVTANIRISSRASIEAGFGSSDNYDGNLVPFSGDLVYEENPTISYRPVTGEAYLEQLMSPVPLEVFTRMTQHMPDPAFVYTILLASANDIYNPGFLYPGQADDPRFDRLVEIMTALTHEHRLHWLTAGDGESPLLFLDNRVGDARVNELIALLDLPASLGGQSRISIPVSLAIGGADTGSLALATRSLWQLVEILTAAVQVPATDLDTGVATRFPAMGRAGRDLRIQFSEERPAAASVAVEYRDGWFYIDSSDYYSKRYFKLMASLWSAAISHSLDDGTASPVLTVPVSR